MDFLKMHDGTVGMLGRHLGMTFFAMRDGRFQFAYAFIKMRICDLFLSHLSVPQRDFRMCDNGIGMPHATMLCRFLRVRNRFTNVRIPIGERRRGHQYEHRRAGAASAGAASAGAASSGAASAGAAFSGAAFSGAFSSEHPGVATNTNTAEITNPARKRFFAIPHLL
jgi:hypothetical protein